MTDDKLLIKTSEAREIIARRDRDEILFLLKELEAEGGPADVPVDAALTRALWVISRKNLTLHWLDECYLLYRLNQEVVADVLTASGRMVQATVPRWWTWESMLAQRAKTDPSYEWKRFCSERLDISTVTASARKRVWEVFAIVYGWSREKLEGIGVGKLQQAVSYAEQCWKRRGEIDPALSALLEGGPHVCGNCDGWVGYEGEKPGSCPHCKDDYYELDPASVEQVRLYIKERKDLEKGMGRENSYSFALSGDGPDKNVMVWMLRPGEERAVPYQFATIRLARPGKYFEVEDGSRLSDDEYEEVWEKFSASVLRAGGVYG